MPGRISSLNFDCALYLVFLFEEAKSNLLDQFRPLLCLLRGLKVGRLLRSVGKKKREFLRGISLIGRHG